MHSIVHSCLSSAVCIPLCIPAESKPNPRPVVCMPPHRSTIGIMVQVELDMPGHASAFKGVPNMLICDDKPGSGLVNPAVNITWQVFQAHIFVTTMALPVLLVLKPPPYLFALVYSHTCILQTTTTTTTATATATTTTTTPTTTTTTSTTQSDALCR